MEFFQKLGLLVSRRWKEKNYNEESFPDVASLALSEMPPAEHVSMWDVMRWSLSVDQLPRQDDIEAKFGDPPLTVYTGYKFRIEVLFWVQGLPAIHQHAFSGAFHVMHGSSIHSLWGFESQEQIEIRLLLGRVSFKRSEILLKGDSRPILAGNSMFHSTYHLDRPSISVVVRTLREANRLPQYSLLPPTIAHAPLDEIATLTRQKQLLRMLLAADRRADFNEIARHVVGTRDAYCVFEFLNSIYPHIDDEEERQNLLLTAKLRHPRLIAALQPALEQVEAGNKILNLRSATDGEEIRFLLAVLRNIPERRAIFSLIEQRFPGRDPVVVIVDCLRRLSGQGTTVQFEESWLLMLDGLLRDRSEQEVVDAFRGHCGHERTPSAAEFRALCSGLQASWLLRSLCLSNPFEAKSVVPHVDTVSAEPAGEDEGARGTSVAGVQACGHETEALAVRERSAAVAEYRCFLDGHPDPLVPHARRQKNGSWKSATWIVNPFLRFSATGRCPDSSIRFAEAVSAPEPMVWVSDPVTSVVNPFVLSSDFTKIVATLHSDSRLSEDLPAELRAQMIEGGLIYEPASFEARRKEWLDSLSSAKVSFQRGYATLGHLLHPYTLAATRAHFRRFIQLGKPRYGDPQTPRRWAAHNEPVARFHHYQLMPIVEEVAGVPLKASYVYFASYHQGAKLPRHVDREQCEFSLSMLIDYSPEPDAESPWPLWLDTKDGSVAIHQRLGDTLIYRGRELPHYRHELPSGHTSTHLFFHYVPADFSGPLD